jgi:acyl dehydratase
MPTKLTSRSLDDFQPGISFRTRARTVTETDLVNFAGLTWDFYPLHTDEEYARQTQFGTRIAHGPLVYSMAIGLMPIDFFGDAIIAYLGVEKLRHLAAVKPGDTIQVEATIKSSRPSSKPGSGVVVIEYRVVNQREESVMTMDAVFLMRAEAPASGG